MLLSMRGPALDRASVPKAEEQVKALRKALGGCQAVVQREKKWRTAVTAALALTFAALVVMRSVSLADRKPVTQLAGRLIALLGSKAEAKGADAAYAAYENKEDQTALRIARPLAEQGDARAQTVLGLIYKRGRADPQAGQWLRRAAMQGDGIAQFHFGIMYAEGRSVPQSYSEAVKWYRLAADQGIGQAMFNLGVLYARGEGVSASNIMAHMWFNLAAAHFSASEPRNREEAVQNRDLIASKMKPDEVAKAQEKAREWFEDRRVLSK